MPTFIKICQEAYETRILERFEMSECHPVDTPAIREQQAVSKSDDKTKVIFLFGEAAGSLMY